MTDTWLADTRTSYDTVAVSYAEFVSGSLDTAPHLLGALTLFADLVDRAGGGPVADVGCGPGHVTAQLAKRGVDAYGIDLSPAMVEVARRDHPGLRFEVGTMTALDLADDALAGLLAFWSLVHVPEADLPAILREFHRVVRPGGQVLLGFHVGDSSIHKTEGYGGHPMNVYVYRRPLARVRDLLRDAGFTVDAELLLEPDDPRPGGILFATA
ncbi:Methyltransferase domain-containing protein [Asanoa hainanensis]|uniref:Methyltransferase domain-containing protein n=1 Tax=Asanoa hainanensis TaxID=560556 RepID=A0A239NMF2_9ACTN|nr:class I SAM-dependent methyltransferase [Asanoa hainanensis]SNT55548.1 Methyltransferase domain-containing protein [Asanoa hainanensis]